MMGHSPSDLRSKNLFKRCVQCNPITSATCPSCTSNEVCALIPASCEKCPEYTCQSQQDSGVVQVPATVAEHKGPVAPVIAGAVIGGVILISIGVYLLWKFALKGKRRESVPVWEPMEYAMEKTGENTPQQARSAFSHDNHSRMSTHTVQSMASTVLTRASNVIQIAFIPGVTSRQQDSDGNTTPRTLVPPVPPIPLPTSPLGRNVSSNEDIHFLPGDLRDSTYSGISTIHGRYRGSLAPSLTPSLARASIASTIYETGGSAVAVSAFKPSMVSVRSVGNSASHSPHTSSPMVPSLASLEAKRFGQGAPSPKPMVVQMPVSREGGDAKSVPPSRATSVRIKPKAVMISKGKGVASPFDSPSSTPSLRSSPSMATLTEDKKSPLPSPLPLASQRIQSVASEAASAHTRAHRADESDFDDDDAAPPHERSRQSLQRKESGPFSDSAAVSLNVPEAVKKAAADRTKTESPFDDKNAL